MLLGQVREAVPWAIIFLPLGSFAVISLFSLLGLTSSRGGERPAPPWSPRFSGYLTIAAIFASFLLSLWVLDSVIDKDGARIGFDSHQWVTAQPLSVNIGVTVDGLTAIMLVVVSGVSLLVQFYSQEYMRDDEGYNRYFAFMSLFTASMLGLVISRSCWWSSAASRCWCSSTRRSTCATTRATTATSPSCRCSPRRCWGWCSRRTSSRRSSSGSWGASAPTC